MEINIEAEMTEFTQLIDYPTTDNIEQDTAEIIPPPEEVHHVVNSGVELTAQETADLCKIMDPEEYGDAIDQMDSEYIESILNKVSMGGVALDSDEPRFKATLLEPTEISTKELSVIIDIQEGRKPKCSPEILEASFEKIASGTSIDMNYDNITDDHGVPTVKQPWWRFFWCCGGQQPEEGPEVEYDSSDSESSDSDSSDYDSTDYDDY
jgi:hypothetical protein